jgi:hypothetical protein
VGNGDITPLVQVAWLKGGSIRASGVTSTAWLNLRGKARTWAEIDHTPLTPVVIPEKALSNIPRQWIPVVQFFPSLCYRLSANCVETCINLPPSELVHRATFHPLGCLDDERM